MLRLFFVYREKELNEIQISHETYHIEVLEDEIQIHSGESSELDRAVKEA